MIQRNEILVIDNDIVLCRVIHRLLSAEGINTIYANDGRTGLQAFYQRCPDLVLLDTCLPDIDSKEVYRLIRIMADTPVILLTILDGAKAIAQEFAAGADDYITKPFHRKILLARVRAVLHRLPHHAAHPPTYTDGYLSIDLVKQEIYCANKFVHLSAIELNLLAYFLKNQNQVLTHQAILHQVWGSDSNNVEYVHVYVSRIRKKLEKDPHNPTYLVTERGTGYRLVLQRPHY